MNDEQLVRLQIKLEYQLNSQGRLVPFPGSTEQARFIVYELSNGYARFFREDLRDDICAKLEGVSGEEAVRGSEKVRAILSAHAPCGPIWTGKSYFFRKCTDSTAFSRVVRDNERFVIVESGKVASWACSARENDASAEAAVETLPEFRRRGFAKATISAWAAALMNAGKTAFSSHSHNNVASTALARSLGVQEFATAAAYD